MLNCGHLRVSVIITLILAVTAESRVTFVKVNGLGYGGNSYFNMKNVSLHECHRWCRDEQSCAGTTFNFVPRSDGSAPQTICSFHSDENVSAGKLRRSKHTYYLSKAHVDSDDLCDRLWSFELLPNKLLRGLDNAIIFTSDRSSCLAACLAESRFICRSVEYNVVTRECHLSEFDRRSPGAEAHLVESHGIEYLENSCLKTSLVCPGPRHYNYLQTGLSQASVNSYVLNNYCPDKQLVVANRHECLQACSKEENFVCRSVMFRKEPRTGRAICVLYHTDHADMRPFAATETHPTQQMLDLQDKSYYLEAFCGTGGVPDQQQQQQEVILHMETTPKTAALMDDDPACDAYGVCYDVTVQCSDTKMTVFVKTSRAFHGRIYSLGRSETCNYHIHDSKSFHLDLSLSGQDCNTQSMAGVYTNTIVLQHHNVVLTKADKMYNVRCTYETTSRNVSFGMIPVRDPATVEITGAPEAPLPHIVILGQDGREANTVRIGDRLTFHIEIPHETPYGIFARSCYAMAKDGRNTFEIIDDRGCPVDPLIFPRFMQVGEALESSYEAFRFTESYGVIFQCNVKYCVGKCEPAMCGDYLGLSREESWGRKRRSAPLSESGPPNDEMTLSKEILVLDFGDGASALHNTLPHSANESGVYNIDPVELLTKDCASQVSIMALGAATALLVILYICTVAYFVAQSKVQKEIRE